MTNREYFLLKIKLKANYWYTPTVEERSKMILYLSKCNDNRATKLLKYLANDENEFIRELAQKAMKTKI